MTHEQMKVAHRMAGLLRIIESDLDANGFTVPDIAIILKDWTAVCIAEAEAERHFNDADFPEILQYQAR